MIIQFPPILFMPALTGILTGFVYGPSIGFMVGFILSILHSILTRSLGPYIIYVIPAMGLLGMFGGYAGLGNWFGGNITMIGIVLSFLYNLTTGGLTAIITGETFKNILWNGTNFILNIILFIRIAPILLQLLA